MSLLSSTQGTPERVWSLVRALADNGGALDRTEASGWLNPEFTRHGQPAKENSSAFKQTLSAATSLGIVDVDRTELRLNRACTASSFVDFCDWVHGSLIGLDSAKKDAVVLETFAWLVVETDRKKSTNWIHEGTNDGFADAADASLPLGTDDDGDRRINTTKLPSWCRWLVSLGLAVWLPVRTHSIPHPFPDSRVMRALRSVIARENVNKELFADEFLSLLAPHLPYLDGGRMFSDAARRISHAPTPRRLSPIFSTTLRNLHDEGAIELRLHGDAGNLMHLSHDSTHKIASFCSVLLRGVA